MSEQQRRRSVIDDGLIRERKTSSRYVAMKRVGLALARKQYTYPIPAAFSRCCPFSVTARDDSKMPQRRRCSQEIIIKTQFFKQLPQFFITYSISQIHLFRTQSILMLPCFPHWAPHIAGCHRRTPRWKRSQVAFRRFSVRPTDECTEQREISVVTGTISGRSIAF